ncbi:MAG: CDP-glycerol--poly(glycerophosphate) glycerophosphotransferase, partial [Pseudodesulfovibrio sp.]|nr:CDP-glycerol--poly(glycerophosphate) glycerophosphotransferase [Pseudodesulfovibrio sp.]
MTHDILAQFAELARVSPKTDLVIFAGRVGGRLMDNAKYLYRHCVQA